MKIKPSRWPRSLLPIVMLQLAAPAVARARSNEPRSPSKLQNMKGVTVLYYTVTDETRTLGDIAVYLYGDASKFERIAAWNDLKPPYRIQMGQRLVLNAPPTLTPEQGSAKLLELWRFRFELSTSENDVVPAGKSATRDPLAAEKIRQDFLLALHKATKNESNIPERDKTPGEPAFSQGERLLEGEARQAALRHFRESRTKNPGLLAPWLYEIYVLRLLGRDRDAQNTARLLLKEHAEVGNLPLIKNLLNGESMGVLKP